MPAAGALSCRCWQSLLGAFEIELRLLALAPLGRHVGFGRGLVRLDLLLELSLRLCSASATASFACSFSSRETVSPLPTSSLARSMS